MVKFQIPPKLPLLEGLCWNIADPYSLAPQEMLDIYQSRWKYREVLGKPSREELYYIEQLNRQYQAPPLSIEIMTNSKTEFFAAIDAIALHLDTKILHSFNVLWCGGSLLAKENNNYRLSLDMDFIANEDDYDRFYEWFLDNDPQNLFKTNSPLATGELRRDRISVRMPVTVNNTTIKVEFIAEERFKLDIPAPIPERLGKLSFIDRITSKLFANRDRWIDNSSYCRDLIDLAILRRERVFPEVAYTKGKRNYKIKESLIEAIQRFQAQPKLRAKCYEILQIDRPWLIIDGIDLLATDFKLPSTEREFAETDFGYLEP